MAQLEVRYENGVVGKEADVYWNLQEGGFSIRSRETESYETVIGHKNTVVLEEVEFVVQDSGRERVVEEGQKNIHAFVRGVVVSDEKWDDECESEAIPIIYNPYEYENFVCAETERPVESAQLVIGRDKQVFAIGVEYKY